MSPWMVVLAKLTAGERKFLREHGGEDYVDRLLDDDISPKLAVALVFLTKRREDPSFTMEDARRLTLKEVRNGK